MPDSKPLTAESAHVARTLREAADGMRRDHGPDHERHEMWTSMADLLDQIAHDQTLIDTGVAWSRSIFWDAAKHHAVRVADAYLAASANRTPPGQGANDG